MPETIHYLLPAATRAERAQTASRLSRCFMRHALAYAALSSVLFASGCQNDGGWGGYGGHIDPVDHGPIPGPVDTSGSNDVNSIDMRTAFYLGGMGTATLGLVMGSLTLAARRVARRHDPLLGIKCGV